MNNRYLFLDCTAGISGDMTAAALLDLGADIDVLNKVLATVPVTGFRTIVSRVKKSGLDCCDFLVSLDDEHENHDHDMEYLHGHEDMAAHMHAECHEHEHHEHEHHEHEHHEHEHHEYDHHEHEHHDHEHDHHDHHTHHVHRGMKEITEIIDQTDMTENARNIAKHIFAIIAKAEAKAHGVPENEVHFHEVGAVDSIVDIISIAVLLDNLDVTRCVVPVLYEGHGTIRCQHGILPVPVPAVANILTEHKMRIKITNVEGELVTPTGAAVIAAIKTDDDLPDSFTVERVGLGAGKRVYENSSGILRAMLIKEDE